MSNKKTKCDFCKRWTGRSCMVTPSPANCREANNEYYQYMQNKTAFAEPQKSLRSWDKNRLN